MSDVFFEAMDIASGYDNHEIIHKISFEVKKHAMTCILGANGCGKTTLLKSLCSLQKHSGKSILEGMVLEDCTVKQRAQKLSYIPQKSGIQMSISVLDVVLMGYHANLGVFDRPSKKQIENAKIVLSQMGLVAYENRDFLTLSEGEKQLVILSRMILEEGKLLLLDEPDSALDFANRHRILKTIAHIVKTEEKACIVCLHDPILALQYCDQLLLIKDGYCIKTIYPQKDSIEVMEKALSEIYGNIKLDEKKDKNNRRLFTMFLEE